MLLAINAHLKSELPLGRWLITNKTTTNFGAEMNIQKPLKTYLWVWGLWLLGFYGVWLGLVWGAGQWALAQQHWPIALAMALGPVAVQVPPRAALDDLISSGGIGRIRSERLRLAVAAYVQALEADVRAQDAAVDLWLTHVAPYRYLHSTLAIGVPLAPRPDVSISVDRDAYVGSRHYTNLLSARILRTVDVRNTHQAARGEVENLLQILDALGVTSAS